MLIARRWVGLAGVLTALLILPILMIHAQAYDDGGLHQFLNEGANCQPPCLLGILPGDTLFYQAELMLKSHAWVERAVSNQNALLGEPTRITWTWNGQQPHFFKSAGTGIVFSPDGITIDELLLEVGPSLGEIWLALGPPDSFEITTINGTSINPGMYLVFANVYHRAGVAIVGVAECPFYASLWDSPVAMRVRLGWPGPETDLMMGDSLPKEAIGLQHTLC